MANKLLSLVLVGALLAISQVSGSSVSTSTPEAIGAAAHRALLGGPADALNRASRPHSSTKEYSGPSKAMGIEREQNLAPVPVPAPELVQPASSAAGAAVAAAQPAPTDATQPAAAVKQQRTLEGGPADIFNRATHARQSTKEVSGPSKATGVNTPSESQQEPSTEPGSRSLLQYGWSGSSASASASAGAGSGGWGGNSWAGAQAPAQSQSHSFGGGFDNGFGGYGFGTLRAAARN